MKKFNIKEWKKKQKKLFKESKLNEQIGGVRSPEDFDNTPPTIDPSFNIDPSQVSTLGIADLPTLNPTPSSPLGGTPGHWNTQGFKKFNFTDYGGWLYQCEGGSYQEFLLTNNPNNTTGAGSNTIGLAVQNALYTLWSTASPYWSFADAGDITPADVVAYCILSPAGTVLAGIKCDLALGAGSNDNSTNDPACGGLWFGEYEDATTMPQLAHNHRRITPSQTGNTGPVSGTTPNTSPLVGTYPTLIDAVYAHSPTTGTVDQVNQYAMNNCNSTSGACDSSYYSFGCFEADQGASNYNVNQNDPEGVDTQSGTYDPAVWSTWDWETGGEGLSGGWLDGSTILGAGSYGGSDVEGCDPGTGIPSATNYDCCTYIGCNDTTTGTLNKDSKNYGVHDYGTTAWTIDVNTNYTNSSSPITLPQIAALNSGASFGCESSTANLPDSTDKSCCSYVGCKSSLPSVIYDVNAGHNAALPVTWYCGNASTPIAHPYAGTRIVGCDTSEMIANAGSSYVVNGITYPADTPTGIPDPNDTTCCWVDPSGAVQGCKDPLASNGNSSNAGCIPAGAGCPYGNVPVPGDFTCCEYNGCSDFTDQTNTWATSTPINGFKYTNQIERDGSTQGGVLNALVTSTTIDFTTGTTNSSGTDPLKTMNGGIINTIDCTPPNFGCPVSLSTNSGTFDGCEGTGARNDLYADPVNPTLNTSCCKFHGCPEPTADNYGPFDPSNSQYGNATAAITDIWTGTGQTSTWVNGTPDVFGCDASSPYDTPVDDTTECCAITACTDTTATNYICDHPTDYAIWCNALGGIPNTGQVTNGGCTFGGCKDSSTTTTKVNDGSGNITTIPNHYQAANYDSDPSVLGCGGPVPIANNFIDSTTSSQFWPTNYDGSQTIVGCIAGGNNGANNALSYTIDDSSGNGTMDWTDPLSSWYPSDNECCNYNECNDSSGFNVFSQLSDSATGGGFNLGIVGGLDANGLVDESIVSNCTYAGCNQSLANNTSTALPLSSVGCENAQGEIDTSLIDCCEFIGCNEPDAYSYWEYNNLALTDPSTGVTIGFAGSVGCSVDTNGDVDVMDDECCEYIGCPDPLALNAGIHSNANLNPNIGQIIKYDDVATWDPSMPVSGKLFCSTDGTVNNIDITSTCCCTYKEGCADQYATGMSPMSTGGAYDPDAGGCGAGGTCVPPYVGGVGQLNNQGLCINTTDPTTGNVGVWTPSVVADCTAYSTYTVGGTSDINGNVNLTDFPQWEDTSNSNNTVIHAYGELDPFNTTCCKWQLGCPDSGEWNPYCAEDQPGVWRILDDTMTSFGGTNGWWGIAGDPCDGGYVTPPNNALYGYGGGWYEEGNIGCDMVLPYGPDSMPGIQPYYPIPALHLEPCCTYAPCPIDVNGDPLWCCLSYNLPPTQGPINSTPRPGGDNSGGDDEIRVEPLSLQEQASSVTPTVTQTQSPSSVAASSSGGYTSPWHPIPNYPNPLGGYSMIDLRVGHPCHCPNLYNPATGNGTIPVYCDTNQPIDPTHPCPLPPPEGCPPSFMPNKPSIMILPPGVWNPLTCECDYRDMELDRDRDRDEPRKLCCGNVETGEIVDYQTATGQIVPSTPQINNDHCEDDLGSEWMTVRCNTDCTNPDIHTSLNQNTNQRDFKCGCRFSNTTTSANAGNFAQYNMNWNIPTNTPIPLGTPLQNYDVTNPAVGCEITFNHTYTGGATYVSGAPNNIVPTDTDVESWECCIPSFEDYMGCMDPLADNFSQNVNLPNGSPNDGTFTQGYGHNPNAIGCPNSSIISPYLFPDPNLHTCCTYALNAGCADALATNYNSNALGCPLSSTLPNSPITAFPNPHNAGAAQPSDYNDPLSYQCCDYSDQIGCADPSSSNFDADHFGCDSNGDGLPDGAPFTNASTPDDSCCIVPPPPCPASGLGYNSHRCKHCGRCEDADPTYSQLNPDECACCDQMKTSNPTTYFCNGCQGDSTMRDWGLDNVHDNYDKWPIPNLQILSGYYHDTSTNWLGFSACLAAQIIGAANTIQGPTGVHATHSKITSIPGTTGVCMNEPYQWQCGMFYNPIGSFPFQEGKENSAELISEQREISSDDKSKIPHPKVMKSFKGLSYEEFSSFVNSKPETWFLGYPNKVITMEEMEEYRSGQKIQEPSPIEPTEPIITPTLPTLPTEPTTPSEPEPEPIFIRERKITKKELLKIVKNAINEVKSEMKKSRK